MSQYRDTVSGINYYICVTLFKVTIMNRRDFLSSVAVGAAAASLAPLTTFGQNGFGRNIKISDDLAERYRTLDGILTQPILKKELFPDPVIIESVELLFFNGNFLCRVRSKDGAEGISAAHGSMNVLHQYFLENVKPFLIGQDARELDLILQRIYMFHFNYRHNGITMGIPLATAEFAILDMLGHVAGKPVAELISKIYNPEVGLYVATEFRELPLEEHFEKIKETASQYNLHALKIKVGFTVASTRDIHYGGIPGKSEKLVPLVRQYFGDRWSLYADSNGYYGVTDAIKMGKLLEEYKYRYFEEPVMFDHFEEIKSVHDNLKIPVASGEQDYGFYNMRWLLANDGISIVQPDHYYFGGFIRSLRLALMADAMGKTCVPHMSPAGLGFVYNTILVSAMPNAGEHHEFKGLKTSIPFECPSSPLKVDDGKIQAPRGVGMGVVIDPAFIAKHKEVKKGVPV